jgi:c-di-GMP-binding flagellar brake protein YcgR
MVTEDPNAALQINDRVRISFQRPDGTQKATCLGCIKEMSAGDYVFELTTSAGLRESIKSGDQVFISYIIKGWTYGFGGAVDEIKQSRQTSMRIRSAGPAKRLQRRNYVRIATSIDMSASETPSDLSPAGGVPFEAKIIDLSGGGFAIRHSDSLAAGTLFDVEIQIPEEAPLHAKAKVIWCNSLEGANPESPAHRIGFAFVGLSEVHRRRIMGYLIVLQQQSLCVESE